MNRLRRNKFSIIYLILVLLILALIFYFSSNNALKSGAQSARVSTLIMRLFGIDETFENTEMVHMFVRKMAHFTLFALLGMSLRGLFGSLDVRHKVLFSAACGLVAACSDEIHQIFVPGRAGMITDVLIDMCGVITGVLFVCGISKIIEKIRRKKNLDA